MAHAGRSARRGGPARRQREVIYNRQASAVAHDCTTLGGNSGSAVIDVATGLVVGLHFGGEYVVANYAVPSWELARNARLSGAGVQFA
jgi:endonuclease G